MSRVWIALALAYDAEGGLIQFQTANMTSHSRGAMRPSFIRYYGDSALNNFTVTVHLITNASYAPFSVP